MMAKVLMPGSPPPWKDYLHYVRCYTKWTSSLRSETTVKAGLCPSGLPTWINTMMTQKAYGKYDWIANLVKRPHTTVIVSS